MISNDVDAIPDPEPLLLLACAGHGSALEL
jgi:hypothetical protein